MNAAFRINGKWLETERLVLRPFQASDLDAFYAYASIPGVGEMAGWKHHESKAESKEILDCFIREDKTFAICLKPHNTVIGSLGVEPYGLEEKLTEFFPYQGREIGYVLGKPYWGMGIMPEAVNAVIHYLFYELELDFLTCEYYCFNAQSRRVQEKCGFTHYAYGTYETRFGTVEDDETNILTRQDWRIMNGN